MKIPAKLITTLQSRKFWAMVAGLATAIIAHVYNQIDTPQMVLAIIASLAYYCTGVAIADAGASIGNKTP